MFRLPSVFGAQVALLLFTSIGLSEVAIPAAATASGSELDRACATLPSEDFSGVQDAPTQITDAVFLKASDALPAYCRVNGYVAPQVGIKLTLPERWNGKLIERGCDGHCGSLSDEGLSASCGEALRRGYACIISDMGHKGTG